MKIPTLILLALAIPVAIVPAAPISTAVAPSASAGTNAARIAPYLEPQTIAVVRVDPGRLDLDAGAALAAEAFGLPIDSVTALIAPLRAWVESWRDAGGGPAWWVLSLDDLGKHHGLGGFVIAEIEPDGDPDTIAHLLRTGAPDGNPPTATRWQELFSTEIARVIEPGIVFCGAGTTLERLRSATPDQRPFLADDFATVGEFPFQVFGLPTAEHRRVFAEMFPRLPGDAGAGPITDVTDGLHAVAGGIRFGPDAHLRVAFRAADPDAATRFAPLLHDGIVAGAEALAQEQPGFELDPLVAAARFAVAGSQLVLDLDEAEIRALVREIAPPAERAP